MRAQPCCARKGCVVFKRLMGLVVVLAQLIATDCFASASMEPGITADIILRGTSAAASGDGVEIHGATITLTKGGVYRLTGSLVDGMVIVDAGKDETVELILNSVTMTAASTAAIVCRQAERVIVTLAEGTKNELRDAANDIQAAQEDEPSAVLYAKDDLLIRGEGSLQINGGRQNGVSTKKTFTLQSGTLLVEAANHGLLGKDSVELQGGMLQITAQNDGIQSGGKHGTVLIEGGTVHIVSGADGIQAESALMISGGEIDILAGGGSAASGDSQSRKALKSSGMLRITGGELRLNSLDDAVHAATGVLVSGGVLALQSGDDAVHAGEQLQITGGSMEIVSALEGLESEVVEISGGVLSMHTADDGMNAVGNHARLEISGGVIRINADGDGVDSNGTVTMSGGELIISGPESMDYGALDYDDSFLISGGVLAAAGYTGVGQAPGADSTQPSVMITFTAMQTDGSTYLLTDDEGTILLSVRPEKAFQTLVLSTPELAAGEQYRLYRSTDGTLTGAMMVYDFTISDIITLLGDTVPN